MLAGDIVSGQFVQCYLQCVNINPFIADPAEAYRHTVLTRHFYFFDIRALWCSGLSARAPQCQKLKMVGYTSMALNPSTSSNLEQLSLKGLNVVAVKDMLSFFGLYDKGCTQCQSTVHLRLGLTLAAV